MKKLNLVFIFVLPLFLNAQKLKTLTVRSPDGTVSLHLELGAILQWSVQQDGQNLLEPSAISLQLENETLGTNISLRSSKTEKINRSFAAINYIKDTVRDFCNQLTLEAKGDYGIIFRVYNDAVVYRFFTKKAGTLIVKNEEANFNFPADEDLYAPIQWDYRDGRNFNSSFEALYHEMLLSHFPKDSLAFLPLLAHTAANKKLLILEADLEDYPGMYLNSSSTGNGLKGVFAPYPKNTKLLERNLVTTEGENYIAKTTGTRLFPWRAVVISRSDKELLGCDLVQRLAADPRLVDYSWVKPGQASWDWWNNWNIKGVNFKAGINDSTYKYYIDFAAEHNIPYIIMDEGWSKTMDLMNLSPNINLSDIVNYGKQKNVGVILWATWYAVSQQMDRAFPKYAAMGVKGFKIDFFDRDDQVAVASTYEIARKAADYKLFVDYHGIFKPTGLQRTYPNVLGYEGVKGMENFKWANENQPRYTTSIPFIRMVAGPMDYTPGAMRNASAADYRPINNNPMSMGTRCQQLAEFIVFYAPLQMLADNPTIYRREKESLDFITSVPTTFDETIPLDGDVANYLALARRKGNSWFVAAMTNWAARDMELDFSFLPAGEYKAEIFRDGVNADKEATDYQKEILTIHAGDKIKIHLAPGGGWVAKIYK